MFFRYRIPLALAVLLFTALCVVGLRRVCFDNNPVKFLRSHQEEPQYLDGDFSGFPAVRKFGLLTAITIGTALVGDLLLLPGLLAWRNVRAAAPLVQRSIPTRARTPC